MPFQKSDTGVHGNEKKVISPSGIRQGTLQVSLAFLYVPRSPTFLPDLQRHTGQVSYINSVGRGYVHMFLVADECVIRAQPCSKGSFRKLFHSSLQGYSGYLVSTDGPTPSWKVGVLGNTGLQDQHSRSRYANSFIRGITIENNDIELR